MKTEQNEGRKVESQKSQDVLESSKNFRDELAKDKSQPLNRQEQKTSEGAEKMLKETNFSIDFGAVMKAVDDKGYMDNSVANDLKSKVGSKADAVIADARVAHASSAHTRDSQTEASSDNVRTSKSDNVVKHNVQVSRAA